MKEATGGALLMGLAAAIIIIFVIVVAFFISYGKSFRLKNEIINEIEQNEGMTEGEIMTFIAARETKYNGKLPEVCFKKVSYTTAVGGSHTVYKGFVIKVKVVMSMDRTILGERFNPRINIYGETKTIQSGRFYDKDDGIDLETQLGMNPCA